MRLLKYDIVVVVIGAYLTNCEKFKKESNPGN